MSQRAKSPMTPERWSQMQALLERALARPAREREEYLRHACSGDDTLIEEVLALANAHEANPDQQPTEPVQSIPDPRIGTFVKSRYRIKSRLGSGGVGVVYLAEDMNLMSRRVVVKFLHEQGRSDQLRLTKFLQEAEALARLDHPGIIAAFDADQMPDGSPFLVMQYVEGQTLRAVVDHGPLPFPRIASILRQLGSALRAAHSNGVIHRDLKPENIMLQQLADGRDVVKLIDFGVARVEASTISSDTAVLGLAGTPSYMAPEHLSGRPVVASDIYSVGVIAFEMITGQRPFTAKHPFALRQQQREGVPRGAVRKLRPECPAAAESAIRRAMEFDTIRRATDVQELCDEMAAPLETVRPPASYPSRRTWIASAAGLAVVAGGAVAWRALRDRNDIPPAEGNVLASLSNAIDPIEQGFGLIDQVTATPIRNAERTGFDRLALRADEQGMYYKRISEADLRHTLQRGWKISLTGRPIIGGLWACADFHAIGQARYDVSFYREPDGRAIVLLCTQHIPTFEGPRYELPDQGANVHKLELIYDPASRSCELFVDGRRQAAGYKGHRQAQIKDKRIGFYFGVSVYRSNRAESELSAVRFEVL